jgi:hypothetical protein
MLPVIDAVARHLRRIGAMPASLESRLAARGWVLDSGDFELDEAAADAIEDSSVFRRPAATLDVPPRPSVRVTLSEAQRIVSALAHDRSVLLLAPPGIGKTDAIVAAAARQGLPCRSLLGTQIAAEDVTGVPRIVGERTVFCPPRVLLPEDGRRFCLFLDELPASSPDVQKALYPVLLERRIGEHPLPAGSWVVAAGNRAEDRALVRAMSSALVNRLVIVEVRADAREWLAWAEENHVREEIRRFAERHPEALVGAVPTEPRPFSTPRAWTSLGRALDLAEEAGVLTPEIAEALVYGTVSPEHAACFLLERGIGILGDGIRAALLDPTLLPEVWDLRSHTLDAVRAEVLRREIMLPRGAADGFLLALRPDERNAMLAGAVERWASLGAERALLEVIEELVRRDAVGNV